MTYLPGAEPTAQLPAGPPAPRSETAFDASSVEVDEQREAARQRVRFVAAIENDDAEPTPEDPEVARIRAENVAMRALTRRSHSRAELERLLRSRELSEGAVQHELDRLERVGLLDDAALAQHLVGVLQERKGLGRSAIAAELSRRQLESSAVAYALELVDGAEESGRAEELAVKRARQLTSLDHDTAVRRLTGFLQRKGYSGSVVRAAVERALPHQRGSSVRFE